MGKGETRVRVEMQARGEREYRRRWKKGEGVGEEVKMWKPGRKGEEGSYI